MTVAAIGTRKGLKISTWERGTSCPPAWFTGSARKSLRYDHDLIKACTYTYVLSFWHINHFPNKREHIVFYITSMQKTFQNPHLPSLASRTHVTQSYPTQAGISSHAQMSCIGTYSQTASPTSISTSPSTLHPSLAHSPTGNQSPPPPHNPHPFPPRVNFPINQKKRHPPCPLFPQPPSSQLRCCCCCSYFKSQQPRPRPHPHASENLKKIIPRDRN